MENKLIIGIGNEAKGDDGLGWAFVDSILKTYPDYKFQYNYQLGPEDAEVISHYDWVLFADASYNQFEKGYRISRLEPLEAVDVFTHSMKPEQLLYLSEQLYRKSPEMYLLEISGYDFEIGNCMTKDAIGNLIKSKVAFQGLNIPEESIT